MNPRLAFLSLTVLCSLAVGPAAAGSSEPTYWKDIRPIFRKYCTACHSAKNVREIDVSGGLALDSYEAARKGSSHPVIEPGKAEDSRLVPYSSRPTPGGACRWTPRRCPRTRSP